MAAVAVFVGDGVGPSMVLPWIREHTPGAKALFSVAGLRPKAKALGYLRDNGKVNSRFSAGMTERRARAKAKQMQVQGQTQIPFGNDNQRGKGKGKGNGNCKGNGKCDNRFFRYAEG